MHTFNNEIIENGNVIYIINKDNGNVFETSKTLFFEKKRLNKELKKINFYAASNYLKLFSKDIFKTVFISLHISTQCNMNCNYCFIKRRYKEGISFSESKRFIDMVIDQYPNAEKYIVDPTGSGEPLLELDHLCEIGEYCKEKSDILKKEVLPMIVTNGMLLSKKNVERLRNAGILFGISLDGDKQANDEYRRDYSNRGTYKRIIENIKKIKDRSLIGVALTITDKNMNLVRNLKHLVKYFPTVSMKPVRAIDSTFGINESNLKKIKRSYMDLSDFLLKQTSKGNLEYLSAILNGDDYFGKFLLRTILSQKVTTRCDAGIGRMSLAPNGKIYACPGSIGINELEIGNLNKGIDKNKREFLWDMLVSRKLCSDCFAKYVCGGECFVNAYYSSGLISKKDPIMCELKRHLYILSLKFNTELRNLKAYNIVVNGCIKKLNRFREDKIVSKFLSNNPEVTFNDVKFNRDKYII